MRADQWGCKQQPHCSMRLNAPRWTFCTLTQPLAWLASIVECCPHTTSDPQSNGNTQDMFRCLFIYVHYPVKMHHCTHIHTHTHIYIYIYIYQKQSLHFPCRPTSTLCFLLPHHLSQRIGKQTEDLLHFVIYTRAQSALWPNERAQPRRK